VARTELLLFLSSLYVAAEVIANVTAGRLVQVGPLVVPGAIFIYAMTFTLRDAIHAGGGERVAKTAVWAGFFANLLLALYGLFVISLPAPPWFSPEPYRVVLGQSARVVVASLTAYLTAQLANTWTFEKIPGPLWLKSSGSNLLAILIDTALFITLAFAGTGAPLLALMTGQIVFKLVISLSLLPLVYWVRQKVK